AKRQTDAWGLVTAVGVQRVTDVFAYREGFRDELTGLMHFGARWYDADAGRWLSEDPIIVRTAIAQGDFAPRWREVANLYAYALNSPLVFGDPAGLAAIYVRYNFYPIDVGGFHVPLLHSAVITVGQTGQTRYYEYGRYGGSFGRVRRRFVPDLTIGE